VERKNELQDSYRYSVVVDAETRNNLGRYLSMFPFKKVLLFLSKQFGESIVSSPISVNPVIRSETMKVLFRVQEVIVENHLLLQKQDREYLALIDNDEDDGEQVDKNNATEDEEEEYQLLDKVRFALELLMDRNVSELKKELILEYLKCCYELLSVEVLYRKDTRLVRRFGLSYLVTYSTMFLKVQNWIAQAKDPSITISYCSYSTSLELLRKLPHITSSYFMSFVIWMINQLIVGNELDPLLLEAYRSVQIKPMTRAERDESDYFPAYFILLKYYLPEKYL
jgi:hypothetical protein